MFTTWRAHRILASFTTGLLLAAPNVVLAKPIAAAAAPASACPNDAADEASASRAAAACHGRVEVASASDEKTQIFANANGSFTSESAAVTRRIHKPDGSWVKPDPTLHQEPGGRLTPAATALRMSFSGGGTTPAAILGKDSAELGLQWPGTLPPPRVSGGSATYPEVFPGVDLVLTAQIEGFTEVLVVKNAAAAANPALSAVRFTTTAKGLRLRQGADGALSAIDSSGTALFGSGTPAMWDSAPAVGQRAGEPSTGSRVSGPSAAHLAMPVELSGDELIVHPDVAMLHGKTTRFPVYIDPAFGKSAWTMINSAFTGQSYWSFDRQDCPAPYASIQCAKVGHTTVAQSMIYRSLFSFPIGSLLGKHVEDAKLSMDTVYSYTNTDYGTQVRVTGPIGSGTTWSNNSSSWGAVAATANSHAHDRVRRRTEWGLSSAVRTAAGGTSGTLTLGLRAVSESDENQWKKFDAGTALLTVIYNSYPNTPDKLSIAGGPCATGSARPYVRTLAPELRARLSDPDGSARLLRGTFYWWRQVGGSRNSTDAVAQGSVVSGQTAIGKIPTGRLADGVTYVVQAIANDGVDNSQYSTTCEFTVDVTLPAPPDQTVSTDYPSDGQAHGGVGTAGTFTIKPPNPAPADLAGYAYTLDPGASAATATQVTASATDHGAVISLTPSSDQAFDLRVWSRDKAGNFSATPTVYPFIVRSGTGPDGRWNFDEQTGDDVSLHGNTAAVTAVGWGAGRGGSGGALIADGVATSAVTTGPVVTRDPNTGGPVTVHTNGSFTVAATVRLDSTAGSGQRVIAGQDGGRTSAFQLSYSVADKKWRFAVATTDVDSPAAAAVLSNAIATTGTWTYLVATYDGTSHQLRLYVNGAVQTATAISTTFDAAGSFTIGRGRQAGAAASYFLGAIDDIRLYARTILATEREFTNALRPNPPLMTFPSGTAAYTGRPVQAVLSAGGDTTVTKMQYRLDVTSAWTTVTLPAAGGQTTVTVTPQVPGGPALLALNVDAAGRQSDIASKRLDVTEAPALTGKVTDVATGAAVAGATVQLMPGGLTQTTASTGVYSFTGINAGTYTVTASSEASGCAARTATTDAEVDSAVLLDLRVGPQSDVYGYTCGTTAATPFIKGTTRVALTGDDEIAKLAGLPFTIPYYGKRYNAAWVSTNGVVTFIDPEDALLYKSVSLPDRLNAPRAAVLPFWDDLLSDESAGLYTATIGTGAEQRFVIEWRNVHFFRSAPTDPRFSFEVVFSPAGDITFNYSGLFDDSSHGARASVGITSPGGNYGLQYSFESPALVTGTAITFVYPDDPQQIPYGLLSGTTTAKGLPLAHATVLLDRFHTTTDTAGHYQFGDVEAGTYNVRAEAGCDSVYAPDTEIDADSTIDLALSPIVDYSGYSCDTAPAEYIPANTVLNNIIGGGADVSFPFPFPFYGKTFNTASVSSGGGVYIRDPNDDLIGGDIESWPGETDMDAQSSVRTAVVGTAPNRHFVVEWRNLVLENPAGKRITLEMLFAEDGAVTMSYPVMPDPSTLPQPIALFFYNLFNSEIAYHEDGRTLSQGRAVVFRPPNS